MSLVHDTAFSKGYIVGEEQERLLKGLVANLDNKQLIDLGR
jgi:hypothetical protein